MEKLDSLDSDDIDFEVPKWSRGFGFKEVSKSFIADNDT